MKKLISIIVTFLFLANLSGCNDKTPEQFAIYSAETGEIIFSEKDIMYYDPFDRRFEFTETKSKNFDPEPFVGKNFVAKLGKKELYEGEFITSPFSLMHDKIVMEMSKHGVKLYIGSLAEETDAKNKIYGKELEVYFKEKNKIKPIEPKF